jgi:para-nitrobenzyl esterase
MSKPVRRWLSARARASRGRFFLKAFVALGAIVGAAVLGTPLYAHVASDTRVDTTQGPVEGFIKDGVAEFLGIPYAAPPVGNLRWRPPVPHAPWTAVRDAKTFGNICLQVTTLGPFAGPANDHEDCLFLNVYSPNVHPERD